MSRKGVLLFIFSLFLIGAGLLAVLGGGNQRDGYHLIGLGLTLFVMLAITGSFK